MPKAEDRSSTVLISIVAGLVGAGVALLLAPRSGRETRAQIRQSANDMKHQAQDELEQMRGKARETLHHAADVKDKVASALKTRRTEDMEEMPRRRPSILTNWDEER